MPPDSTIPQTFEELLERNEELQRRLEECEETLRAIREGEVDAVLVAGRDGDQVYTLRGADEAYRVMVQEMAEGALTLTADGLILFSNEQFASMLRMPLERVIGSRIQNFVAAGDEHIVSALLAGNDGGKAEVRLRADTETPIPVYLSVQNLVLDDVQCLCLIVTDLSEQKRNQEMAAVMEAVPAVVLIAQDPKCQTIRGNGMAHKLFRVPAGENVSQNPLNSYMQAGRFMKNGREIPRDELAIRIAAGTGRAVHDFDFDVVFDDGTSRSILGNAVPLFDEAGKPRGAVGAFVDVTERKRSEERLQQSQKLESIGVLAGGIAHDFNNLLVGVIGNASLAQDVLPPGSEVAGFLNGIIKAGEQLANLTRQMLAYSGKGRFQLESVVLSDLIREMSGLVQPSIPGKIALQFELEPNMPPIEADRSQMLQVLMNLVLNGVEAIGAHTGVVTVKTGVRAVDADYTRTNGETAWLAPGQYVYLEVRDTGCGMDGAMKTRIFDPFFTTKFVGRGLGLAAVSGIVRGHKGAIHVTSAPGEGSCFTVIFPAIGAAAERKDPVSQASPPGIGTILVVDDDEIVRDMARRAIARNGFEVLVAGDGSEAIEILTSHPGDISLVVLDQSMPGLNGDDVLPRLREIRPGVKVVISSGYDEISTMALFKGQLVSGFIQKPYTAGRLTEKIKAALT